MCLLASRPAADRPPHRFFPLAFHQPICSCAAEGDSCRVNVSRVWHVRPSPRSTAFCICLPPVGHGMSIVLGRPPPGGPRLQQRWCSMSLTASGGRRRCCTVTMVVVTAALPRGTLLLPANGSGLDPAHVHVSYWCSVPGTQELAIRRAVFVCPHALPNVGADLAWAFP